MIITNIALASSLEWLHAMLLWLFWSNSCHWKIALIGYVSWHLIWWFWNRSYVRCGQTCDNMCCGLMFCSVLWSAASFAQLTLLLTATPPRRANALLLKAHRVTFFANLQHVQAGSSYRVDKLIIAPFITDKSGVTLHSWREKVEWRSTHGEKKWSGASLMDRTIGVALHSRQAKVKLLSTKESDLLRHLELHSPVLGFLLIT